MEQLIKHLSAVVPKNLHGLLFNNIKVNNNSVTCILTVATFLFVLQASNCSTIMFDVQTDFGTVRGNVGGKTRDGRDYFQFLDIPYAKAERFQPPTDPDPWSDVRDATAFGNICPQITLQVDGEIPRHVLGKEDCLNLNIFTPKAPSPDNLLPVLVYFHGTGGDIGGAPDYAPDYYLDEDILLITFNARLGFLGYLNLGLEEAAGNQRLKDEIALLKWVRANIQRFGGDPDKVTIMGSDSGGGEVGYLVASARSAGLMARAISQAVTHLSPYMFIRDPFHQAKLLGQKAECTSESPKALYECLKKKDVKDLLLSFHRWVDLSTKEFLKFGPSIETVNPEEAVITENPYQAMINGRISNKIPWLMGVGYNYGAGPLPLKILRDQDSRESFKSHYASILPNYLDYSLTAEDEKAVTSTIVDTYLRGKSEIIDGFNDLNFTRLFTDRHFIIPCVETGRLHVPFAPVYSYVILHTPVSSWAGIINYNQTFPGGQVDDTSYQFPWILYKGIPKGSRDYEFSKNFIRIFTSFAQTGKPRTWGGAGEWVSFDKGFIYGVDEVGYKHNISDEYKQIRHGMWMKLRKDVLASELKNPSPEVF